MQIKNILTKQQNTVLAVGFTGLLCLLVSWKFDYFYALNDDMLMKDIMAGIFTGKPEGHNIQMLYPVSFLISIFYNMGNRIAWYALFLVITHFLCFYLVAKRTLQFTTKLSSKILVLLGEGIFIVSFFLWELVFLHYTVTSGLLAATAAFLFYTTDSQGNWREYVKRNVISILFVWLAFMIRSEMLLLVLPLIASVGMFKWFEETPIFTKENAKKYLGVFGIILVGMLLTAGLNKLAYSSTEWKSFQRFFDARTQVYDFYGVPSYEEHKNFYDTIQLSEEKQNLLENYNFGLEPGIDETRMIQIQDYAKIQWDSKHSFGQRLEESIWKYRNEQMTPRNPALYQLVMLSYFVLLLVGLSNRKLSSLWNILFLFAIRSGLWLFLLYRNRMPDRITHPLCLMELFIIAALLLRNSRKSKLTAICVTGAFVILTVFGATKLGGSYQQAKTDMLERETINEEYIALQDYAKQNKDSFYLFDVMSTVPYSEKAFAGVDNEFSNIAYLGGWISKSPLNRQKLAKAGWQSEEEALLTGKQVFLLTRASSDISWVVPFFEEKGMEVTLTVQHKLSQKNRDTFFVYQIERRN